MCSFKSVIALKDRVFCPDYDSHEKMLGELKIEDDYIGASKTFVRVELSPADGRADSDVEGWRLKVDQDVTPDWWDETADLPRIKAAVKAWCDNHVLKEGKHEVHDGVWYADGSTTVRADGSTTVNASGSAKVIASDSATVRADGSTTVNASGSAKVIASDSATVRAYGSATVNASGSATVRASDSAKVRADGSTTVNASGSAKVIASDSAKVIASDSATVRASGSATVRADGSTTVNASGSAKVIASDSATVTISKYAAKACSVTVKDSAVCIDRRSDTIATARAWKYEVRDVTV